MFSRKPIRRMAPQLPLVVIAPGLRGSDLAVLGFAHRLRALAQVRMLDYGAAGAIEASEWSFHALIERLAREIRANFGTRTVHIVGFAFGSRVARALACQLGETTVQAVLTIERGSGGSGKLLAQWNRWMVQHKRFTWLRASSHALGGAPEHVNDTESGRVLVFRCQGDGNDVTTSSNMVAGIFALLDENAEAA